MGPNNISSENTRNKLYFPFTVWHENPENVTNIRSEKDDVLEETELFEELKNKVDI